MITSRYCIYLMLLLLWQALLCLVNAQKYLENYEAMTFDKSPHIVVTVYDARIPFFFHQFKIPVTELDVEGNAAIFCSEKLLSVSQIVSLSIEFRYYMVM